jgi:hypothetical protein
MKIIQLFSIIMAGVLSVGAVMAQDTDQGMSSCPMMKGKKGDMMMEWHQKALEKFKAQNAELDKLVQAMNEATADKKVDAMAAVINKAMEDRKTWQADMEARQQKMMECMKEMKPGKKALKSGTTPATN